MGTGPPNLEIVAKYQSPPEWFFRIHLDVPVDEATAREIGQYLADGDIAAAAEKAVASGRDDASRRLIRALSGGQQQN